MKSTIYNLLDTLLRALKRRPYQLNRRISLEVVSGLLIRRVIWLARGLAKSTLLQLRPRAICVASCVTFRNSRMCHFGRGVTFERGVIIDGLAEHGVYLGDHVSIGAYSLIRSSTATHLGAGVVIGRSSSCDAYSFFGAGGLIRIGDNIVMGEHVSFHAESHRHERTDIPIRSQGVRENPITIEDDCWIGSNVTFLGGAHVARGSIVGAGALVNEEFPPFSVIVGVPAKVVRSRVSTNRFAGVEP
jgi:acetyltransferase-like isoleucine patch superfamily enzyme